MQSQVETSNLQLVLTESEWRKRPQVAFAGQGNNPCVTLARWTVPKPDKPISFSADQSDDCHIVALALNPSVVEFSTCGRDLIKGRILRNALLVTSPGQPCRGVYYDAFDCFHVYLPQTLIAECYAAVYGQMPSFQIVLGDPQFMDDSALEQLVRMLVDVESEAGLFGPSFVEGVSLGLTSRLLALQAKQNSVPLKRRSVGLAGWRLKRATDYIEANLSQPIYLIELSNTVGLTRMHFAAQFRASTGLSPHAYILRRKIARAQQLLQDRRTALVDIAASLGFRSQAHFTTVFKEIVGSTPARWRDQSN